MKKISQFAKTLKTQQASLIEKKLPESENYKTLLAKANETSTAFSKMKVEHSKLTKEFEALKQEKEQLLQFRDSIVKEKKDSKIKSELIRIAKDLNVKESAVEDVINLVKDKFTLSEDEKVFVAGKETDNDAAMFMTSFLQGKEYFIQPTAAESAKIPPVVNSQKPSQQVVQTPQKTGQLFSNFFSPKK